MWLVASPLLSLHWPGKASSSRLLPNPSCPKGSCCQGNPPRAISLLRDWSLPPRGLVDISSASQLSSRDGQLPLRENEDSEVRDLHEKTVLSSPSWVTSHLTSWRQSQFPLLRNVQVASSLISKAVTGFNQTALLRERRLGKHLKTTEAVTAPSPCTGGGH